MRLYKCTADDADFCCPECGGAVEDVSDYDYDSRPDDRPEIRYCPYCQAEFLAHVETIRVYIVNSKAESGEQDCDRDIQRL